MRIGIDLGGTKTEVIALGPCNEELFRKRSLTPRGDYPKTISLVSQLVFEAESTLGHQGSIGVGIPGSHSLVSGLVKNANSTWLNGKPFHVDLQKSLGREIRLSNDANCLAVSEAVDGAASGYSFVFAAILGTGCGGGLLFDGKVINGRNGLTGEWGHNSLPWGVESETSLAGCYCGKKGCNEMWISGSGFCQSYFRESGELLSGEAIVGRLEKGESLAARIMGDYENRLARALSSIVNTLDPDVIVLGGGMSNVGSLYNNLPGLMKQWVFGGECDTPILKAHHGDSSGVRGAAFLWPNPD